MEIINYFEVDNIVQRLRTKVRLNGGMIIRSHRSKGLKSRAAGVIPAFNASVINFPQGRVGGSFRKLLYRWGIVVGADEF